MVTEIFFSHYKAMEANDPQGMANLDPRGMVGRSYVAEPHGFREKDFWRFFIYSSI